MKFRVEFLTTFYKRFVQLRVSLIREFPSAGGYAYIMHALPTRENKEKHFLSSVSQDLSLYIIFSVVAFTFAREYMRIHLSFQVPPLSMTKETRYLAAHLPYM